MIQANATLCIQRIALSQLIVTETASCFPEKYQIYYDLLTKYPEQDVDPLIVEPSGTHEGMYTIANGKHRYAASIIAGRKDVLCIVVGEKDRDDSTTNAQ